jgi:hypothetical protein
MKSCSSAARRGRRSCSADSRRELGMQPRAEVDPDLCVAMGAAIQAAVIAGGQAPTVLVDVTPYTFGTSALEYFNGEMYPYLLRAADPQEHADSGLQERRLLHRFRWSEQGRHQRLPG